MPPPPAAPTSPIGPGNGCTTDRYSWTQTLQDVSVAFPVPAGTKGRDVTVEIRATHARVLLKGAPAPLLDAPLHKRVRTEDSSWTMSRDDASGGATLALFLTKENQMEWWASVGQGEPAIDVTKVEPENSKLGDLDAETRKTVEKMMFDNAQKAKGLPTSDEMLKQDALRKFMAAHPECVAIPARPCWACLNTNAPPPPHTHTHTAPAEWISAMRRSAKIFPRLNTRIFVKTSPPCAHKTRRPLSHLPFAHARARAHAASVPAAAASHAGPARARAAPAP